MQVGDFKLQQLLSTHTLFTRYAATHVSSNAAAEVRILSANGLQLKDKIDLQLRRNAWVASDLVRKVQGFQLVGETAFIALDATTSDLLVQTGFDLSRFIVEGTSALQAAHEVGLTVGPIDTSLFGWNSDSHLQLDATGLLSYLNVLAGESCQQFRFAAPESVEDGCGDPVCDACSWGLYLQWLLASPVAGPAALPVNVIKVIDRLCLPDPAERATLGELLNCFRGQRVQSATSTGTAMMQDSLAISHDAGSGYEGTVAAEIQSSPSQQLTRPSKLGRFVIESKLGEGGMGAVYKARDLAGDQLVAIKVLSDNLAKNPRAVRRFAKEARLLALARSPYVANLVEAHLDGDVCYLVSECVDGGSLGDWLQAGEQLPVEVALALVIDAARGLSLAHDRSIVHRDIKPDNILLTVTGRELLDTWRAAKSSPLALPSAVNVLAKLADFGIARAEHQSESLAMTAEHSLLGTPLYMAPEQCLGSQVDPRADVYSLGITLYRLLAGRVPFQAESNLQLMTMHANDAPPAMRQFAPDVPEAIVHVIDKCLAKNPDARYSHARELLIDLENLLRGQPTAIGLHPPIIQHNDDSALTFEHVWDLQSSPALLWPYVAHTDRVNHAMGLTSVEYVTQSDPVMGVVRLAETKVFGQRLQWREHPYEWIEGKRLSVLREFSVGPFEWFVNIVELQARRDGGTTVRQTLKVKPRSWVGKTLAKIQLGNKSQKSFGKVYADIDRFIQAESGTSTRNRLASDPWGNQVQLSVAQRSRLTSRLASLGLTPAALMLGKLIEHGSELEIARIRPYALADRSELNRTEVMETCLKASREGLLILLWDILCPSCRIPSDVVETLSALKDHAHCQACNIQFELDFSRSIEMIFRVHPEIRAAETRTYCIGGPAWSRHVVAQVRLAQGECFVCEVELDAGSYVIRGPQLPFSIPFRVSPTAAQSRWEVPLAHAPPTSESVSLRSGQQAIWFWNDSARDLEIRIERMAARHDAVTAATASSSALFRELYGDQVLAGGQLISIAHITYLLVKLFGTGQLYRTQGDAPAFSTIRKQLSRIEQAVRDQQGAVIKVIGETVVATFPTLPAALNAADRLCIATSDSDLGLGAVVHSGPAVVATLDERLDYFGRVVHESLALLDLCQPSGILTTAQTISAIDVHQWCQEHTKRITTVPHDDFALVNIHH